MIKQVIDVEGKMLSSAAHAKRLMMSGAATVTLRSIGSNRQHTYRVMHCLYIARPVFTVHHWVDGHGDGSAQFLGYWYPNRMLMDGPFGGSHHSSSPAGAAFNWLIHRLDNAAQYERLFGEEFELWAHSSRLFNETK